MTSMGFMYEKEIQNIDGRLFQKIDRVTAFHNDKICRVRTREQVWPVTFRPKNQVALSFLSHDASNKEWTYTVLYWSVMCVFKQIWRSYQKN